MYSVILMAAMTANTADAPAFHWQKACGCTGGLYLHSGGYGSCMGCWGAGYGCCGGWSGCSGSGGCWGSSFGACYGCYGCMGCYGVYDGGSGGCYGGYGSGGYGGWYGYGAANGYGPATYPAGNPMSTGATVTPPATGTTTPPTVTPPATGTPAPPAGTTPPGGSKPAGTSAKVIIEKPADATIYVDGRAVTSEGTRQTFATPDLVPGQAYYYTVRIEAVRDGKAAGETRRVIVRAGDTVQETFREPAIVTASATK